MARRRYLRSGPCYISYWEVQFVLPQREKESKQQGQKMGMRHRMYNAVSFREYWFRLKGSYMVARIFFLLLLNCSAWPCLGPA